MAVQKIGQILLQKNKITQEQLDSCINIKKETKEKLGHILVSQRIVRGEDIAEAIAQQVGWPYYGKELEVDIETLKKIDADIKKAIDFIETHRVVPIILDTGKPALAYEEPFLSRITELLKDKRVSAKTNVVVPKQHIERVIDRLRIQGDDNSISKIVSRLKTQGMATGALEEFISAILNKAIALEATDVHIEPSAATSDVRIRIDGLLYPEISVEKRFHENIINVVYDKAKESAPDSFKSRDAGFRFNSRNRDVDIRLSAIPTKHGISVALRILELGRTLISLEDLGYHKSLYGKIADAIRIPYGIILVTGPTGSGKTTTLYSILNAIKSPLLKTITLEDPVENDVPGVQQCEVDEKSEEKRFGVITKRLLRQDPDIILIGEIRDEETAREVKQASMTGHKVFSTLHTNTAIESILRLLDLGLTVSDIGNTVNCIVSQRLLRKLCSRCKEVDKDLKYKDIVGGPFYKAKGCEACSGKGYRGRTVVAEVLQITTDIKNAIIQDNFQAIEGIAREDGFRDIRSDALRLIKEGVSSVEEVNRVIGL